MKFTRLSSGLSSGCHFSASLGPFISWSNFCWSTWFLFASAGLLLSQTLLSYPNDQPSGCLTAVHLAQSVFSQYSCPLPWPHPQLRVGNQLPSLRNFESSLLPESLLVLGCAFEIPTGLRLWSMFSASQTLQDTHSLPVSGCLPYVNMESSHSHIQRICLASSDRPKSSMVLVIYW